MIKIIHVVIVLLSLSSCNKRDEGIIKNIPSSPAPASYIVPKFFPDSIVERSTQGINLFRTRGTLKAIDFIKTLHFSFAETFTYPGDEPNRKKWIEYLILPMCEWIFGETDYLKGDKEFNIEVEPDVRYIGWPPPSPATYKYKVIFKNGEITII